MLVIIDVQGEPQVTSVTLKDESTSPVDLVCIEQDLKRDIARRHEEMLRAIEREVKLAVAEKERILIVEQATQPYPTHPRVLAALGSTPYITVRKTQDDGSREVMCAHAWYSADKDFDFRVCGRYTKCCVAKTARGLRGQGMFTSVIPDACFPEKWQDEFWDDPPPVERDRK